MWWATTNLMNRGWMNRLPTSAVLYWEAVKGPEMGQTIVADYLRGPYERAKAQGRDRSVIGPVADFTEEDYNVFVYSKGPLFFDALRTAVTPEIFAEILQAYYRQHRYEIAYPPDLLNAIEQVSGQDVEPLYQEWLASPTE